MDKKHFQTLLDRYIKGICTIQEKKLVEQWFALQGEELPKYLDSEINQIEERLWNNIQNQPKSKKSTLVVLWRGIAAAVAIIFLSWGISTYFAPDPLTKEATSILKLSGKLITYINSSDSIRIYTLSDGTEVHLTPGGSLSYQSELNQYSREVYLKGKAFFNVAHDSRRPFYVHIGDVLTKVLGTSFWVTGKGNNEAIEIAVVTGKVSVEQNRKPKKNDSGNIKGGVILTANQWIKYTPDTHTFETGLVAQPVPIDGKNTASDAGRFVFDDAPVTAVIDQLATTYGIEIILENEMLSECLFKGNISNQSLYVQLDLLCSSINATYEVRGTRILISGKGCSTLSSDTYEIT